MDTTFFRKRRYRKVRASEARREDGYRVEMDREEQGQTGSCKHILELRSILHVSSYDVYVIWEELVSFIMESSN